MFFIDPAPAFCTKNRTVNKRWWIQQKGNSNSNNNKKQKKNKKTKTSINRQTASFDHAGKGPVM